RLGKFQIADEGSIFLDEIATISPSTQIKMLQILQERWFTRVGGDAAIATDVRVVAATNVDLKELCREGSFRTDLFYRLNVFPIELPPLRKRPEDIPLLVEIFLERLNRTYNKDIKDIDSEVLEVLKCYSWPGNIRELENLIERAYILEKGALLTAESFPSELFTLEPLGTGGTNNKTLPSLAEVRKRAVEQAERRYLLEVMAINKGRIDQTAAAAGVTTRQLHNILTKCGLHKEDFR
ncbi:MAG: sigma-54-dependent Fis family transcriptional regulator, partial [Deltaproteobacteria bacterium]|nr:sigma-54-dependent Fis family transcriptional regulator [Deltaproteobacteria bacterium]